MKAEELFPGALVRVNRDGLCIKKDTIVEVRAVDADDKLIEKRLIGSAHCRQLDDEQFDGVIWCEYLDPLPLTPEILEKNGFIYNDMPFVQGWEQFGLTLYRGGDGFLVNCGENISMKINAVHELQHALRLCGITLNIEV